MEQNTQGQQADREPQSRVAQAAERIGQQLIVQRGGGLAHGSAPIAVGREAGGTDGGRIRSSNPLRQAFQS